MISAPRGEGVGSKADNSTDRLREWVSDKEGEVKKSQIFADVICERPQEKERQDLTNLGREKK